MSLSEILAKFADTLTLTEKNKVKCAITEHEMSPNATVVMAYLNGKKFKKAKEWYSYDYSEFLPHIVPDKRDSRKLYCRLTKHGLNKIPEEVKKHVNGKRFLRLKEDLRIKNEEKAKKKTGENDDEEMDADDVDAEEKGSDNAEIILRKEDKRSKKMDKKQKIVTSNKIQREVEEDNLSDLIGSDHDDDDEDIVAPLKKGGHSNETFDFDAVGDDDETEAADEDDEEPRIKKSKKGIVGKKRKAAGAVEKKKIMEKQRKQNKTH